MPPSSILPTLVHWHARKFLEILLVTCLTFDMLCNIIFTKELPLKLFMIKKIKILRATVAYFELLIHINIDTLNFIHLLKQSLFRFVLLINLFYIIWNARWSCQCVCINMTLKWQDHSRRIHCSVSLTCQSGLCPGGSCLVSLFMIVCTYNQ